VGLLVAPGKGVLLFCPAVLLGLAGWRKFHRAFPCVSWVLGASVLGRVAFVIARHEWHGGFALGPRVLLLVIPFLLLPACTWLDELFDRRRGRALAAALAFSVACASQQFYFVLGEIFSYYHRVRIAFQQRGADVFVGDRLHLDWGVSPLVRLHEGLRGPFLLLEVPLGNLELWLCGTALIAAFAIAVSYRHSRRS
jgi:hypothetical protein